ncbi:MAG: hypothetical protein WCH43_16835, partial [Verrucomicrobiota bacterium]
PRPRQIDRSKKLLLTKVGQNQRPPAVEHRAVGSECMRRGQVAMRLGVVSQSNGNPAQLVGAYR